ncbi:MAG: hypothetical protein AABM29_07010 [Actinomycetota bacterium]
MAALHGAPVSIWRLEESFVTFVNGHEGAGSFAAPAAFVPTAAERIAMSEDHTADDIRGMASKLGPHLPLNDPQMRQAAQLLIWLRRTRETWGPGRLVLCDRILERVCEWAGVANRRRFIEEYLRLPWAVERVRTEIAGAAWQALNTHGGFGTADQATFEEIRYDPELDFDLGERRWTVNLQGALNKAEWMSEHMPEGSHVRARLIRLKERTVTGQATATWIRELAGEFDVLERRARRIRNALIHGGPVGDGTAEGILPFAESLAVEAIYPAVEGQLEGADLVDYFLDRRKRHAQILAELTSGKPASEALFWRAKNGGD